jgi:NADPH-ferrihemoprotein reductase
MYQFETPQIPLWLVSASGVVTLILASALAYLLRPSSSRRPPVEYDNAPNPQESVSHDASTNDYPGGNLFVYFATQTGTAESFARQIEREASSHGFCAHVIDLEDTTLEDLVASERRDEKSGSARAVFLTATYGEGEAPDNANSFVQAVKEKAITEVLIQEDVGSKLTEPEACLGGLEYCVFGLGNRQYDHFNAMGKFFDRALERLGGTRFIDLALGDDDGDLEGDFETWKEGLLWPTIKSRFLSTDFTSNRLSTKLVELPSCQYWVEYHSRSGSMTAEVHLEGVHGQSRHYFTCVECPVIGIRELRSGTDEGSTVHVEIDVSGQETLKYEAADNIGIIPENEHSVVESVALSLGFDLEQVFSLKAAPGHDWHGIPFPMPISVRDCLTRYCDLTGAPRRADLRLLAAYATDPLDRSALLRLSSKEGKAEYKEKITGNFVGIADLLRLCPSISMPLEHFLSICPLIQTRFYTISSSSSVYPNAIHLTVAVTKEPREVGPIYKGLCSNYLASANPGTSKIRVFTRPSTFRLPLDCSLPIILVGPGTGIAPMRALLQERAHQRRTLDLKVGPNILYFGCRNASTDFLYEDELRRLQAEGDIAQLNLAFSRQQLKKIYVQHLLVENAKETWDMISRRGAYVYVCGGVKMGSDVAEAFRAVFMKQGSMDADAARSYFSDLAKAGRYVQELWS